MLEKRKISFKSEYFETRVNELCDFINNLPSDTVCLLPICYMCDVLKAAMLSRIASKEICKNLNLSHFLPTVVWDAIKLHHFNSFNNLRHRLFLSHFKKFNGLLTRSDKVSTKGINYTFCTNKNKFFHNTSNLSNISQGSSNDINIVIDSNQLKNKSYDLLDHPNNKWFINLTNSSIPRSDCTTIIW